MRNKAYKISIAVMAIVFFITSFTGCGSNTPEKEIIQKITSETTPTVICNEEEPLTGWRAAYKKVIVNTLEECKIKYPDETNYGGYGLYDFDSDDIPELFVELYGSSSADRCIRIYDFDGEEAVYLDSIEPAHSWVYGTNRDGAFLLETSWMGVSMWNLCEFKNDEFVSSELASYYPDGFGDDIKPQENPLPDMGYEIKEIDYYSLDDSSGIKN